MHRRGLAMRRQRISSAALVAVIIGLCHPDEAICAPTVPGAPPSPARMAAIAEGAAVDIDASRGVLEVHDSFDGETGEWSRGTRVVCGPALDEYLRPCRHHEECIRDKIKDVLDGHTFACDRAGREITCSGAYHGYDDGTSSGVLSLVFRDGGSGRYTLDAVVTADHPSYSDHAAERARMADQRRFVRRALSAHRERCGAGRTKSTK